MQLKDKVQQYLASALGPLVHDGYPLVVCVMVPDGDEATAVIITNVFRLEGTEDDRDTLRSGLARAVSEALAGGMHPNATVSGGRVLKTDGSN